MTNATDPCPTTYADASALLGPKDERKIGHNTTLHRPFSRSDFLAVRFYRTNIVTFYANGWIRLNSGGYRTVTTKERINRYLSAGYSVFQHDRNWYLGLPDGTRVDFAEGMLIPAATAEVDASYYTPEIIGASDGAEIHRDDWPEVQALVDSGTVRWASSARGPGHAWRRAATAKVDA